MTATYSIAYLCLSGSVISGDHTEMPVKPTKKQIETNQQPVELLVRIANERIRQHKRIGKTSARRVSLVGGDTSYHMADYASLHLRFQQPFRWAYRRFEKAPRLETFLRIDDPREQGGRQKGDQTSSADSSVFPVIMITTTCWMGFAGNSANRTTSRTEIEYFANVSEVSTTASPGFRRYQETSYIALRLPLIG